MAKKVLRLHITSFIIIIYCTYVSLVNIYVQKKDSFSGLVSVSIFGSPRRCGGQGDILSGSVAVFLAWARKLVDKEGPTMSPTMLGCIAGSALMRKAASLAFEDKKRSTLTSDIIECLGRR
ncbi:putative ATP-dependent NAD(P)H-hydrate dehydratase [Helianthus annuus]|nr:putative ATP-dependent NAD(P)H-hydrate dehydratase [Helianthus annuus]